MLAELIFYVTINIKAKLKKKFELCNCLSGVNYESIGLKQKFIVHDEIQELILKARFE